MKELTNKEMKKLLLSAYKQPVSEKEKMFIRKYERRSMQIVSIIRMELRYMGIYSYLVGLVLTFLLFMVAHSNQSQFMWIVSSLLPLFALMSMILIGKSRQFGMHELEAASRFSLRFLRLVQMLILGTVSLLLITVCAVMINDILEISIPQTLCYLGIPYLFNVWGCLLLTRKWHGDNNVYGCVAITVFSSVISFVYNPIVLYQQLIGMSAYVLLGVILGVTVREMAKYIKESEDLLWNLS